MEVPKVIKKAKFDEHDKIEEPMDFDEEEMILSIEDENKIKSETKENFIAYCNRKNIKKDKSARTDFNLSKSFLNKKLEDNQKLKDKINNKQKGKNYGVLGQFEKEELMQIENVGNEISTEEELKLQKELKETYPEYCKRLKISKAKSRNKYNASIKSAKERLAENEKKKEFMREKRASITEKEKTDLSEIQKLYKQELSQRSSKNEKSKKSDLQAQQRSMENEEEIKKRLQQVADSMKKLRENETEDEKTRRLQKVAESVKNLRENETEDEKSKRLQKDAESKQIKRENETEDENSQRLLTVKNQMAIQRTIKKIEKQEKLKKERAERIKILKKVLPFVIRKGADFKNVQPFKLGKRDKICKGCGAKHFRTEKVQKDGTFTSCCKQGKIKMESGVPDYPQNLKDLMTKKHKNDKYVKVFDVNKRMINSSLSCAHMYAKNVNLAPGVPYLKIQGKVLHKMPRTYLPSGDNATFGGQNYIVDSAEATVARVQAGVKNNIKLNEELMKELDETIREINIFAQAYTMLKETVAKQKANEKATGEKSNELRLVFKGKPNAKRNYDRVEAENEIALVYTPGPDGEIPRDDIVIFDKKAGNNTYEVLPEWDPRVEPLSYT
uniref:Uncharacterized protein n=1 Tax=Panagrolaimus superbus TaxID=310955 RepID=A0A914YDI7_9BILA